MPVYGIDSPYLRCPSRLTTEVGIPGAARFIVEALIQAQPEGPFLIGEFSGGAMFSYKPLFASVVGYHQPPMTAEERPRQTTIIWGKKNLIDRCSRDVKLIGLLADPNIRIEPFAKLMEDAKMSAIEWGFLHKTHANLVPKGWDRNVGEKLCLSIDADRLEMSTPGHVHLLHGAMEESLTYLSGPDN